MSGVSSKRSVRTLVLASLLASAGLSHALWGQVVSPATSPAPALPAAPLNLAASIRGVLNREQAAVVDQTLPQTARDEAASRLLTHQTSEARSLLLKSTVNSGARLAVARALRDDPAPDAASVNVLESLLGTDDDTTVAAAHALAIAGNANDALSRLIKSVTDERKLRVSMRAAATRGLGSSTDIRAARILGALLDDRSSIVRDAACDALNEMTGISTNGRDADAWRRLVQQETRDAAGKDKTNEQFHDFLVERLRRRQCAMPPETMELLQRLYLQLSVDQKAVALKRMLNDPQPGARVVGVRLFNSEDLSGQIDAKSLAESLARVRDMIGDSSPAVRQEVALTLGVLNKKEAADDLMTQLAQETEPAVRVEIVRALAKIGDLRVVPQLLVLLMDPSPRVRIAAADALRVLGRQIKKDPLLAAQVIAALKIFVASNQGDVEAAGVEALVPLADPGMVLFFKDLLSDKETPATRRAALRGLQEIGDPRMAYTVIQLLSKDKDESVRLAALDTFEKVGSFAYHESLFRLTKETDEPDASIRRRAWEVFQKLLPSADPGQLRDYAELFRKNEEFGHRLAILMELANRDEKNHDLADLAAQRENIGDAYVQLHQPELAVPFFRQALDYWQQNGGQASVTAGLIRELMDALLDSRQYAEAAAFAREMIGRSPETQRIVAPRLVNRAEDLLSPPVPPPGTAPPAPAPRDALRLATEGLKITLDKTYHDQLERVRTRAAAIIGSTTQP